MSSRPIQGGAAIPVVVLDPTDRKIKGGAALPVINVGDGSASAYENTIIVAKSGGDYTTIKDALAAATARTCIVVYPGIYQEDNPLPLAANVTLKTCGELNATRIEALNANQDLFTSANFAIVQGFSLANVSGTGWIIDIIANHAVVFRDCVTFECVQGFRLNQANAQLTIRNINLLTILATMSIGIENNAGNLLIDRGRIGEGSTITTAILADGANAITTIQNYISFETGVSTFFKADNNARTVLSGCSLVNMNDGAVLQGGSDTRMTATSIFLAGQDAIRIENVGTGTNLVGQGLTVESSTRYDVNILSATATVSGYGQASLDQMNFVTGAQFTASFIDLKEDDEGLNVIGELHVGTPEHGTESVFGGGDSYTRGMLVYTYNPAGAVWTDVSVAARSASGSTFTFPAVAQNNAIYVAASLQNVDYLQHYGIKISQTVAAVLGAGLIVVEYWNGATWVAIDHLSTLSSSPYTQYANAIFERTGSEQIRYPFDFLASWTKNDPGMGLGTNYFWIRFRIATAITTAPVFQQYKLHTSRFEANADGVTEYFGNARYPRNLLVHQRLTDDLSGAAPSNDIINFSTNISLTLVDNGFNDNSLDGVGIVIPIPVGLDTSIPITLEVIWHPDGPNAGNVELEVNYATINVGDTLDGSITDTNIAQIIAVGAGSTDITRKTSFEIPVEQLVPGEQLVLSLFRDATAGNIHDTLAENLELSSVLAFGYFWRP